MIAKNEKDVVTLIQSMPIDILNLIDLKKEKYQLFSHKKHRVEKKYWCSEDWTCQKVKDANKCLSGLDEEGKVNAKVNFYCDYCKDEDGNYLYFCDNCVKADLLIQLL